MLTTMIELAEERRRQLLEDASEGHLAAAATGPRHKRGRRRAAGSGARSRRSYRRVVLSLRSANQRGTR